LALLKQRFVGRLATADFEDVLATALFRIWQNRMRFDPALASLRVWFFRIAENVARDVLKHGWHKARQLELSLEPTLIVTARDDRSTEDDVDEGEVQAGASLLRIPPEELRELLAQLPDSQRRIVVADADSPEGLVPSQELAKELGIPSATVRVYRRRALERLRRAIEQRELTRVCESEVSS
jgi:RNA polymerase sigma factor (sigma-70 family)